METEFKVWKTIKLGKHKSIGELHRSLKDDRIRIGDMANDMLSKITLAKFKKEVTLHSSTVKELTSKNYATNRQIKEAICAKGHNLCPAEVGPQLRSQYPDQFKGEYLRIAMESITDSDGDPRIFDITHTDGGLWILGYDGHPDTEWLGEIRFVFASCK